MTEILATTPTPPPRQPWPRSLWLHMIYCLAQLGTGLMVALEGVVLFFSEDVRIPGLEQMSNIEHWWMFFGVVGIALFGLAISMIAAIGLVLPSKRGLWRWRLWTALNAVMMTFTICSPITLALGIPAAILWSMPATRHLFDDTHDH
jgi:ABC-type multidrug transport system permease subunit